MKKVILIFILMLLTTGCGEKNIDTTIKHKGFLTVKFVSKGFINDNFINKSIDNSLEKIRQELKVDYEKIECKNKSELYEKALIGTTDEKETDIIITVGKEMLDIVNNISSVYKNKKFIVINAPQNYKNSSSNVVTVPLKLNEVGFLGGLISASVTKTGIISFVGENDSDYLKNMLVGFIDGAKKINNNIKIDVDFIKNYNDEESITKIINNEVANNVDTTFLASGEKSESLLEKFSNNNINIIGSILDQEKIYATKNSGISHKIVSSVIIKLDIILNDIIKKLVDKNMHYNNNIIYNIKNGMINIVQNDNFKKALNERQRKQIVDIVSKVYSSEIKIQSYFDMSKSNYTNLVQSVITKNLLNPPLI